MQTAISPEIREKIGQITNLPTLPQVATRLMKIVNDPVTSSSDVAFIIGQDLSLSAKVLRLANSAFYGMPRTITNINNAVVILGLRVINTMVLSLTVFDMFPDDKKSSLFDRNAFWRHCLACGLISKLLVQSMKKFMFFDPEEAFCAGLLHDIGKVAMEQYLHEDFHRSLIVAREKKMPWFDAEKHALGYAHTDVADWLTSSWDLPVELQAPLVYHHTPSVSPTCSDCIVLCHFADYLCYEMKLTIDDHATPPQLHREMVDRFGFTPAELDRLKNILPDELAKMDIFLEFATHRK